jgi:hypothetical protein
VREKFSPGVHGLRGARRTDNRRRWFGFLCVLAFVPACNQGPSSHTIDGSRVVESAQVDPQRTTTTAERFGLAKSTGTQSPHGMQTPSSAAPSASGLAWTTPAGWTQKPSSSMRVANFSPAGDEHAECYLTMLSGDAGGLAANVNRWRTQIGLGGMSAQELEKLPRKPLLGRDAVLVDFAGTWKGMGGNDARDHWRLAGLLLVDPNGSAFLKMTGPDAVIEAQVDAMCALARSFRPAGTPEVMDAATDAGTAHPVDAGTASTSRTSTGAGSSMNTGTGTNAGSSTSAAPIAAGTKETVAGFSFTVPASWHKAPDRPARAFTLFAGAGEGLECYVTTLSGDAGGALANVNRWRGQLGLTSITQTDLATMPSVRVLGRDAVLVECDGTAASLIGASCNGSDRSVFVKMNGPRDLVRAQRAAFLAFCGSLAEAK